MPFRLLLLSLLLVVVGLTGCGVLNPGPTPTPDPLTGTVILTAPPEGAVIYASALYVAGTLTDSPANSLLIRLKEADGSMLAEASTVVVDGAWSLELVHGYDSTTEPLPVTVEVVPAAAPEAGVFASRGILFAPLAERPEGTFVQIITPEQGTEVGGEELPVSGTASGIEGMRFTVDLVDSRGGILSSQVVELAGRYPLDELPWQVVLNPGETTGNAIIRITLPDGTTQNIPVILTEAAG